MSNINNGHNHKASIIANVLSSSLSEIVSTLSKKDSSNGLRGLDNIGNTCFMNSALQCLSNTPGLTKYFLTKKFQSELNPKTTHQIVEAYYNLLKALWLSPSQEQFSSLPPEQFRESFISLAESFSGFRQHDSQEFLIYLLDKIHDDLNRIVDKPYIEINKEGDNAPDECWKRYLSRDDSIIVDLFQGQLKNRLCCLNCGHINNNYEAFMMLSLPIPQNKEKIVVTYIDLNFTVKKYEMEFEDELDIEHIKSYCVNNIKDSNVEIVILDNKCRIKTIINNYNERELSELMEDIIAEKYKILVYERKDNEINVYASFVELITKYKYYCIPYIDINILSYPIPISINPKLGVNKVVEKICAISNMQNIIVYLVNYENNSPCLYCGNIQCSFCNLFTRFYNNESIRYILQKSPHIVLYVELQSNEYSKEVRSFCKDKEVITKEITIEAGTASKLISLYNCIELFLKEEILTNDNKWFCPTCKEHQDTKQKFYLYKCPPYLIIQLKRFKSSSNTIEYVQENTQKNKKNKRKKKRTQHYDSYFSFIPQNQKNGVKISYPVNNFDLSQYVIGPDKSKASYDLYGVVQHYGDVFFGHYTAMCKNDITQKWYEYNDSRVTEISDEAEIEDNQAAYLLFYKLHNI